MFRSFFKIVEKVRPFRCESSNDRNDVERQRVRAEKGTLLELLSAVKVILAESQTRLLENTNKAEEEKELRPRRVKIVSLSLSRQINDEGRSRQQQQQHFEQNAQAATTATAFKTKRGKNPPTTKSNVLIIGNALGSTE